MECQSCLVVGERSIAVKQRNGEAVCEDCAEEIDSREQHTHSLRESVYDERGIRRGFLWAASVDRSKGQARDRLLARPAH